MRFLQASCFLNAVHLLVCSMPTMPGPEDINLATLTAHTVDALNTIHISTDLPDAFQPVPECLQYVKTIVIAAQGPINRGNPNRLSGSYGVVKESLNGCKGKAAALKRLLERAIQAPNYRERNLQEAESARSLIKHMYSENVEKLATVMNLTTLEETRKLRTAIEGMSKEELPVSSAYTNYGGNQHINSGRGTQNVNSGTGHQFVATSQHFGAVPL